MENTTSVEEIKLLNSFQVLLSQQAIHTNEEGRHIYVFEKMAYTKALTLCFEGTVVRQLRQVLPYINL